jgi:hypothetical protein
MAAAADALRALLISQVETVRLRAADLLLAHGLKVVELAELQARVEELERRATDRDGADQNQRLGVLRARYGAGAGAGAPP